MSTDKHKKRENKRGKRSQHILVQAVLKLGTTSLGNLLEQLLHLGQLLCVHAHAPDAWRDKVPDLILLRAGDKEHNVHVPMHVRKASLHVG